MSGSAYARAVARENRLWSPFTYSFPFDSRQTEHRVIIYGLYSRTHLNWHKYLEAIEDADTANLLNDYNAKIAELTAQEQLLVLDIITRRYLAGIDKLIHDEKMITAQTKINAEDAEWDAKFAALAADEAAIETLAGKVAVETTKTQAKITELEAYIKNESVNLDLMEVEVAEKEIQSAKVDIAKLDAANAVLRIQVDTLKVAMEMVEVDLQIARTTADIARTEQNAAQIDLLKGEITIAKAQTGINEKEVDVAASRVQIALKRIAEIEKEIDYYQRLGNLDDAENAARLSKLNTELTARTSDLSDNEKDRILEYEMRTKESNLGPVFATSEATLQARLDGLLANELNSGYQDTIYDGYSRISVANIKAVAEIGTTLTHIIQRAS